MRMYLIPGILLGYAVLRCEEVKIGTKDDIRPEVLKAAFEASLKESKAEFDRAEGKARDAFKKDVVTAKQKYDSVLDTARTEASKKMAEAKTKYLAALEQALKQAMQANDLEAANTINTQKKQIESQELSPGTPEELTLPWAKPVVPVVVQDKGPNLPQGQPITVTFNKEEDLKRFVYAGGRWSIKDHELVGEKCSNYATFATAFKKLNSVTFHARILLPSKNNLRFFIGPIHVIFNWEVRDENHFRNGPGKSTLTKPSALIPGQDHEITFRQSGEFISVLVDGKVLFQTTGALAGTISFQGSTQDNIAVKSIVIDGEPDPNTKVTPETRDLP